MSQRTFLPTRRTTPDCCPANAGDRFPGDGGDGRREEIVRASSPRRPCAQPSFHRGEVLAQVEVAANVHHFSGESVSSLNRLQFGLRLGQHAELEVARGMANVATGRERQGLHTLPPEIAIVDQRRATGPIRAPTNFPKRVHPAEPAETLAMLRRTAATRSITPAGFINSSVTFSDANSERLSRSVRPLVAMMGS